VKVVCAENCEMVFAAHGGGADPWLNKRQKPLEARGRAEIEARR
jgi:hypothetical protein